MHHLRSSVAQQKGKAHAPLTRSSFLQFFSHYLLGIVVGTEEEFTSPHLPCMSPFSSSSPFLFLPSHLFTFTDFIHSPVSFIFLHPSSSFLMILRYALPYFSARSAPAIIISYVCPGNIYPVTEHPHSKNSLSGYVETLIHPSSCTLHPSLISFVPYSLFPFAQLSSQI